MNNEAGDNGIYLSGFIYTNIHSNRNDANCLTNIFFVY